MKTLYDEGCDQEFLDKIASLEHLKEELACCPFCGGIATYIPMAESLSHPGNFWPDQIVHDCKIMMTQMVVRGNSKSDVYNKWNNRTDQQEIKRLKDALMQIAQYPKTREDEAGYTKCRKIAFNALFKVS